jgi:hypothetical protein
MDDDCRIYGELVAAPARAKDAEVAPVHVEGGFETSKVSDTGHHTDANRFYWHGDSLCHAVDGEITLDIVGSFPVEVTRELRKESVGNFSTSKKSSERSTLSRLATRVSRLAA